MSSAHAAQHKLAVERVQRPPDTRTASERAGQQLTIVLFAGIVALAIVGTTIAILANSIMRHGRHGSPMMSASAIARAPQRISLNVTPGAKPGPKGERYDAFSKTSFAVKVDRPVQLTIDNKDDVVHSITATAAGVSVVVMPGVHTYTLVVRRAGRFKWICAYPCDPFSMAHVGYMQGYITAT